MADSKLIIFPKDRRDAEWWNGPVLVDWEARRELDVPVLMATGTIRVEKTDPGDVESDDDLYETAGRIIIAKPFLWQGDVLMAMDDLSSDLSALAAAVLDGSTYRQDFSEWFNKKFGEFPDGDPIFVDDLVIDEAFKAHELAVATMAALDALAVFGSSSSPIIGFHRENVRGDRREELDEGGLFGWVHPLRGKRWKGVTVAARPQEVE